MNYAKALTEYSKKHNVTQEKMAIKIGCSYSLYRLIVKGYPVSVKQAKKIDEMLKGE